MRAFRIFRSTIEFFQSLSFEVFAIENIEEIYGNFENEIVRGIRENFDSYEDHDIKQSVFRYLGYDTRYGFNLNIEIPVCKQIWTYVPYIDDNIEYEDHFQWINGQLERVLGDNLPISDIEYKELNNGVTVRFLYNGREINLKEENFTMLSCEYIMQTSRLLKRHSKNRCLYILDYGSIDDVLFSCSQKVLEEVIRFLKIDRSRIQ